MNKWLLFLLLFVAIALGVVVPIMDNDAAHHAAIALQMCHTGDYVTLTDVVNSYVPYFDKPHFQFWLVAASFNMFGVSTIVYKLSSLIFVLLALFSTYKLGEYLMPRRGVGSLSALVLCSMVAFMLNSSVDIRMDAILTGSVALAVWQGVVCIGGGGRQNTGSSYSSRASKERFRFAPYLGLALGLAMAYSTKGLYGVVITALAMLCYMISVRRLNWLFSWRFLFAFLLFATFSLPVIFAYYEQFSWEGVRFILYEQVFYRTGGEMYGSSSANDALFFLHSLLWVILPWSILYCIFAIRDLVKRNVDSIYALTLIAPVVMLVILSFSSFKLPHYMNPLFPMMAIFIASRIEQLNERGSMMRAMVVVQKVVVALFVVVAVAVNYYSMPFESLILAIVFGLGMLALVLTLFKPWRTKNRVVEVSVLASVLLWLMFNMNFYPQLMRLQAGSEMGPRFIERGIEPKDVALIEGANAASLEICHKGMHPFVSFKELKDVDYSFEPTYLWIDRRYYEDMMQDSIFQARQPRIVERVPDYHITSMTPTFLNPKTRASVIDTVYIVRFDRSKVVVPAVVEAMDSTVVVK